MVLLEDQRHLQEDLERLEDATADLLLEDPPHVCSRSIYNNLYADMYQDSQSLST